MKQILVFVFISVILISGCIQAGMLTGSGKGACRIINETYVDIKSLNARVMGVERQILWSQDLGYYAEGTVSLKNTDNESGWFVLTFRWLKRGGGGPYIQKLSRHLNPGDIAEFKSIYPDTDPWQGVFFLYEYDSYPDSKKVVKREREREICDQTTTAFEPLEGSAGKPWVSGHAGIPLASS